MKRSLFLFLPALLIIVPLSGTALAGPDKYMGDSAIYGTTSANIPSNVLFVIDNSAGMKQQGVTKKFDNSKTYTGPYTGDAVYIREAATGGTINYNSYGISVGSVTCTVAKDALTGFGAYYGPLKKNNGSCDAPQSGNYYLGNFLNYLNSAVPTWKANTVYGQGDSLYPSTGGNIAYVCVQGGTSGDSQPSWPATSGVTVADGTAVWEMAPDSILSMVQNAVDQAMGSARDKINAGLMVFGNNNHGAQVLQPIQVISSKSASGSTNLNNLTNSVDGISLLGSNLQPVNEAIWDAGVYYRGQNSSSTQKISSDTATYPSPITLSCQKNFVVVLTTGNSPDTEHTKGHLTDLNKNGTAGDAQDAAWYNYSTDNSTLDGSQGITTYVVQLLSAKVPILEAAATTPPPDNKTHYYQVWSPQDLYNALQDITINIVSEENTSFVAPVVPVSPENRTYSGTRVYMGFFKPITKRYWIGNLKKYGINGQNNIIDRNGDPATYVDLDGNRIDDLGYGTLPDNYVNGSFKIGAQSYWSSADDAGVVESGGAGGKLAARDLSANPRNIYTFMGANTNLTDDSNKFRLANLYDSSNNPGGKITADAIDVSSNTEATALINFIHGFDAYDEDGNGNTSEKRGKYVGNQSSQLAGGWIMGDVLHSKPLIVNYASYVFNSTNESACDVNKSMIFVGSNDGMLHAFTDCDGEEAWSFIPPDMLGSLKHMTGETHTYFVDSSPTVYVYDKNNDGTINTGDGDKVILIFGERRGGGADSSPTKGSYYALDVSNPAAPVFLWSVSNSTVWKDTTATTTTDYGELAESWSEPKIVKMNIGGVTKIVAFVGAGYDNINEDGRYGATQTFPGTSTVTLADNGDGAVTSSGTNSPANPKGRGIYAIEIATLNSAGVPSFSNSGNKIWGCTFGGSTTSTTNPGMLFSFPGEISALDMDSNGYVDRLYAGDTGGNIWRFKVGNSDISQWEAAKIFSANPGSGGSSDNGRKFFYKPSIVMELGTSGPVPTLFFGTGDREHPLNRGVVDRFYAVKDKGQSSAKTESDLLDVTTDQLQTTTIASGNGSVTDILSTLKASSNYGWYIRLDENAGEKVLAAPTVFNKVAYFTTYAPYILTSPDPCKPGNQGTSRIYAVDYLTGEAVLNYNKTNDSLSTTNKRATSVSGQVLVRSDRVMTLGSGIPSGIVMIINPSGETKMLIGVGGVIPSATPKKGGSIIPLYWRQK